MVEAKEANGALGLRKDEVSCLQRLLQERLLVFLPYTVAASQLNNRGRSRLRNPSQRWPMVYLRGVLLLWLLPLHFRCKRYFYRNSSSYCSRNREYLKRRSLRLSQLKQSLVTVASRVAWLDKWYKRTTATMMKRYQERFLLRGKVYLVLFRANSTDSPRSYHEEW